MNAYAVDVVQEHNKVLILGESLPEDAEDAMSRPMTVPWRSIGWFHNRLIVKDFKAIIEITSPTSAKVFTITSTSTTTTTSTSTTTTMSTITMSITTTSLLLLLYYATACSSHLDKLEKKICILLP